MTIFNQHPLRVIVGMWLVWSVVIIGYQAVVDWRYQPNRPDRATAWTPNETARTSQRGKIYLLEPFMNRQVSWDSEYYLSIAIVGYDDPEIQTVDTDDGRTLAKNYAFFPLYPYFMRALAVPLNILGMNSIATTALAGVLISLVGTLAALFALYDLTREELGEDGALRTVFYLLIFPSAFFLAQVYTEGLFIGLAFGCLALINRRQLLWAGVLAALAVWTRSVGLALAVPLLIVWLRNTDWKGLQSDRTALLRAGSGLLAVTLPIAAYLIWRAALGEPFDQVQTIWFGRGILNWGGLEYGFNEINNAFTNRDNTQMMTYYVLEGLSVLLALVGCIAVARRYPFVALFSLAALFIIVTSGAPQSLIRYVLTLPALFIFLGRLGRNAVFDRGWVLVSVLLLAMQTALFSWDMWVA
ncbi:MAG: hypothetical protein JNJ61_30920 [Anaerolineae bacterium]|nr:hypothetical protein [Anaerolineae bacterium]